MTRKSISILATILILSTFAVNFKPFTSALARPTGWRALTGILPTHAEFYDIAISPDSQYVVFTADVDVDGQHELYSVPLSGTLPTKLNPSLVSGGEIFYFAITADSSRIIYLADQEVDERRELYSIPINGGLAAKLNGPLPTGGNVQSFQVDTDTGRVVYTADQSSNDIYELYSVPGEGGPFVKLNPLFVSGGNVYSGFKIDPISDRVVYSADQDTNDLYELYSVPITGGLSIKLNLPTSQGVSDFQITPGAAYVMFRASPMGTTVTQLYGVNAAGGTVQRRSHDLNPGQYVSGFRIGPDGTQVVYKVTEYAQGGGNLYRTGPLAGASQILTVAEPGFGVSYYDYTFTPDGEHIVCIYQYDADSPQKLISVKTSGFPVVQADLFVPGTNHFVGSYKISSDSQWVVYEDYPASNGNVTLSAVPTIGGSRVGFG